MCETRLDKAPPPPTGTTAWPCHRPVNFACNSPSASRYFVPVRDAVSLVFLNCMRNLSEPVPAAALHTGGAWCAVVACRDSASRSVQNSPCWASWWRERYKTLPACRKSAKLSHFGCAGRVLYRKWGRPWVLVPGFCRSCALRPGSPCHRRSPRRWRWGYCAIRSLLAACRRRVAPLHGAIPPDWRRRVRGSRWYSAHIADHLGGKR